jgi:hypothetical protein
MLGVGQSVHLAENDIGLLPRGGSCCWHALHMGPAAPGCKTRMQGARASPQRPTRARSKGVVW